MLRKIMFLLFAALIQVANCGVLLWGSESMEIPSLKQFNNEDFDLLTSQLNNPKVIAFRGDPMKIATGLENLMKNKFTAYVPSSHLFIEDVIDLDGSPEDNFNIIQTTLKENESENTLAVIISLNDRLKRETDAEDTTESSEPEANAIENEYEPPAGPILYSATGKAMIYSSKPPFLRINNGTLNLGKAAIVALDSRHNYTRLSVTIPVSEGKITIRFKFVWNRGYWYLPSAELLDTKSRYMLTVADEVMASKNFSYHCTGETLFTDDKNEVLLIFFDMQVQPDSQRESFNDAYDCVNFTTAPIWSGIFVTSILIVVLGIGLGALNSIKTMDKFDNYKTKQLSITTSE